MNATIVVVDLFSTEQAAPTGLDMLFLTLVLQTGRS